MEEIKIKKTLKNRNFTCLDNDLLQSTEIDFFTKGLFIYLLSLPDDWTINVENICNNFNAKRAPVLKSFKVLIDLGYCKRVPIYENGRLNGQSYFISDSKIYEKTVNEENTLFTEENKDEISSPPLFSDHCKFQTTENFRPLKKQGDNTKYICNTISDNLSNTDNLSLSNNVDKIISRKNDFSAHKERYTTFENSEVFKLADFDSNDYSKFRALFPNMPDSIDYCYYFHAVNDWSIRTNKKSSKKGWIATVRPFMRRDISENKLRLIYDSNFSLSREDIKNILN